ncbi:MAG TPA: hypothetical protein VEJ63_11900 [Planctomycetota bacterium]|nr:hypothetical protein [Planctomycetota bacterium]
MPGLKLDAHYYQQFDADVTRDVPGEGYGGWKKTNVELSLKHTAVVVMHAWDTGTPEEFPGWWRCVEYLGRADKIVKTVFPPLLRAVRSSPLPLFHVVGGGEYHKQYPGWKRAVELAGTPNPALEQAEPDDTSKALRNFRSMHAFVGEHNRPDVERGFKKLDFPAEAKPQGNEGIAENAQQLFALCKAAGVNHLIYAGFAINWCLLMSPGGMLDMSRHGVMCSALKQAVTAVENKETAREELCKQLALWRVALAFGFVFDVDEFTRALAAVQ